MSPSGRSKIALCVFLSLFVALPIQAQKLADADRETLLRRLDTLRKEDGGGMSASFTETRETRLLQKPLVTSGTMTFQSPGQFRREITGGTPSLTVSDGEQLWIYYPNFNEAELYTMGEHSIFDDSISALTAGLSYARMPEFYAIEAFRDAPGYRLILTPKRRNLRRMIERMTLWLDGDLNPIRTVVDLPKGDTLTTTYRKVERGSFPVSQFRFTPPADATVSRPMSR